MSDIIYDLDDSVLDDPTLDNLEEAQDIVKNDDGSIDMRLSYPVTLRFSKNGQEREETSNSLHIRRANGEDIRLIMKHQSNEEKVLMLLFTRLTGETTLFFDKMDAHDVLRFQEEIERFFPLSQKTGKS